MFFLSILQLAPLSTLLPYTTLFRSEQLTGCLISILHIPPRVAQEVSIQCDPSLFKRLVTSQQALEQAGIALDRSEEHTSELQSLRHLVCRLLLEKKKTQTNTLEQHN